jgi:ABC-type transport system substrate-binding protein
MNRTSILVAGIAAAAAVVAIATPTLAQKYGGTLRIGMDSDVKGPAFAKHAGNATVQYGSLVAEGLVDYDEQCNLVPGLATSWDISDDAMSVTFHLRKGVKFHNGREMTAEDVKKNIEYRLDKKNKSRSRSRFRRSGLKSMAVLDKHTIRFDLKKPTVAFFNVMEARKGHILAPESLKSKPPHPIGTGPFKYVEWKPGQHMKLARHGQYWKKDKNGNRLPYVDAVIVKPIGDATTRLLALKANDIDWSYGIPFDQVSEIRKNKSPDWMTAQIRAGARWIFMQLQQSKKHNGPLQDIKIRQAVAYAIDKSEILDGLTWGISTVENQVYPKGHTWYFKDLPDPYAKANLKKAKKLLAEAGYPNGLNLSMIVRNQTDHLDFATLVQAQLKRAGIKVTFRVLDYAAHRKAARKPTWDLNLGHYSFLPDPHWRYRTQLASKERTNYGKFNNKKVDKLFKDATGETDAKKRRAMYREAVTLINKDVGIIFFGHMPIAKASRKGLKNFVSNCQGDTRWSDGGAAHAWFANGKDSK